MSHILDVTVQVSILIKNKSQSLRSLNCAPWCSLHVLVQHFGIWSFTFSTNLWVGAPWRGSEAPPPALKSTFSILQFQNCPPSNSSALCSCSVTFGQMCLHQVDHNLQGFPHKPVKPVYWAPQLFLRQRDQFASFGEFSIVLISRPVILVASHCTEFAYITTYILRIFFLSLNSSFGWNDSSSFFFDLLFPFCLFFAVRSGSVLGEVGTTSHHGCLHSTGSTAVEELHLPTKTNRESRRRRHSRTVISLFDKRR